jgi:hypothetical protein
MQKRRQEKVKQRNRKPRRASLKTQAKALKLPQAGNQDMSFHQQRSMMACCFGRLDRKGL